MCSRGGKLLERKPRTLHNHVIEHRLERGGRCACDVVGDLIESASDRELCTDARYRKSSCLGSERGGTRHSRVHLDYNHLAIGRVHGELDVATTRGDAYLADYRDGR